MKKTPISTLNPALNPNTRLDKMGYENWKANMRDEAMFFNNNKHKYSYAVNKLYWFINDFRLQIAVVSDCRFTEDLPVDDDDSYQLMTRQLQTTSLIHSEREIILPNGDSRYRNDIVG